MNKINIDNDELIKYLKKIFKFNKSFSKKILKSRLKFKFDLNHKIMCDLDKLKEENVYSKLKNYFKKYLLRGYFTSDKYKENIHKLNTDFRYYQAKNISDKLKFKVTKAFTKMYEILHKFNLIKKYAKEFV